MVTKDSHIPVLYRCYKWNHNDITEFKTHLPQIITTAKRLTNGTDVTVVFNKGNMSKEVITLLQGELYFVTSLIPSDHENLLQECRDQMACIRPTSTEHEEITTSVTTTQIGGTNYKIVIGYSPSFFEVQTRPLLLQIQKAETILQQIQQALFRAYPSKKGRRPTITEIRTQVEKVLNHDRLNHLISYTISGRKYLKFQFQLDEEKLQEYSALYGGKTIHIPNRHEWPALDIIQTYRDQAIREDRSKETKGTHTRCCGPPRHGGGFFTAGPSPARARERVRLGARFDHGEPLGSGAAWEGSVTTVSIRR